MSCAVLISRLNSEDFSKFFLCLDILFLTYSYESTHLKPRRGKFWMVSRNAIEIGIRCLTLSFYEPSKFYLVLVITDFFSDCLEYS